MKLTMVIADDEQLSLKSEEMLIKKEFPDIEIVGMAEDGIELKSLIESLKPDMAIVDIRMPGLTGLEVIELLKSKGCNTHFLVNTAHSDFEYVKSALNMKADGYLVKPGRREESIEVISNMFKAVKKEKLDQEKDEELKTALQITIPTFESELLLSIFTEHPNKEEFNKYCEINKVKFEQGCIVTMLTTSKYEKMDIRKLNQTLSNLLEGVCEFLSTCNDQYLIIMLIIPEEIESNRVKTWCGEIAQLIADEMGKEANTNLQYGLGNIYHEFTDMKLSYSESLRELVSQENKNDFLNESTEKIDKYIGMAKNYICQNYKEDISLDDCANEVGISPFYLSHIFRDTTGQTFVEYLSVVKIDKAKHLCSDKTLSIKEIAAQCGYSNITYFYRVFKKATGVTIGEYRKGNKNV